MPKGGTRCEEGDKPRPKRGTLCEDGDPDKPYLQQFAYHRVQCGNFSDGVEVGDLRKTNVTNSRSNTKYDADSPPRSPSTPSSVPSTFGYGEVPLKWFKSYHAMEENAGKRPPMRREASRPDANNGLDTESTSQASKKLQGSSAEPPLGSERRRISKTSDFGDLGLPPAPEANAYENFADQSNPIDSRPKRRSSHDSTGASKDCHRNDSKTGSLSLRSDSRSDVSNGHRKNGGSSDTGSNGTDKSSNRGEKSFPIGSRVRVQTKTFDSWRDGIVVSPEYTGYITIEVDIGNGDKIRKHMLPSAKSLKVNDATASCSEARKEVEERARKEAEEKAAAEAARKAAEEKATAAEAARKAAEEKATAAEAARKAAEEKARKKAEERARKEAEEKAAAETARKATEDKAKKEAEERVRKEAEKKAAAEASISCQIVKVKAEPNGDFKRMIENNVYPKGLYVFGDSTGDYFSEKPGSGNAVIRPFNQYCLKEPKSAGICTGHPGHGFERLSSEAKAIIDADIDAIGRLLAKGTYEHLIYSAEKGNLHLFGQGAVEAGDDVREYIVGRLKEFDGRSPAELQSQWPYQLESQNDADVALKKQLEARREREEPQTTNSATSTTSTTTAQQEPQEPQQPQQPSGDRRGLDDRCGKESAQEQWEQVKKEREAAFKAKREEDRRTADNERARKPKREESGQVERNRQEEASARKEAEDLRWTCPQCGEINKASRLDCNNCGKQRAEDQANPVGPENLEREAHSSSINGNVKSIAAKGADTQKPNAVTKSREGTGSADGLCHKGFSVHQLLCFFKDKVRPMGHATTAEAVVREIIIPETAVSGSSTCYMDSAFMKRLGGPRMARKRVSHALQCSFANTMLNIVLDASGLSRGEIEDLMREYDRDKFLYGILDDLGNIRSEAETCLLDILTPDALNSTYWMSMFAIDENRRGYRAANLGVDSRDFSEGVLVSLEPEFETLKHLSVLKDIHEAAEGKGIAVQCIARLQDAITQKLETRQRVVTPVKESNGTDNAEKNTALAKISDTNTFDSFVSCMVEMSLGIFCSLPQVSRGVANSLGKVRHLDANCLVSARSLVELGWGNKWTALAALEKLQIHFARARELSDVCLISERLQELNNLQYLHMDFGGCSNLADVSSIGTGMQTLRNLRHLHMNFGRCSQLANVSSIGLAIGKLKDLQHLHMVFGGLFSQLTDVSSIGKGLKDLRNLQHLHMDFGRCSELADVSSIGNGMKELKQLHHLHMVFGGFLSRLADVRSIGRALTELKKLENLHMSFVGCWQLADVSPIGEGMKEASNLHHLHMNFSKCSQLADVSSILVMKELSKLHHLHMDFSDCSQIADVSSIGKGIQKARSLQHLHMNFSGCSLLVDPASICSGMNELSDLHYLHLNFSRCGKLADVSSIGMSMKGARKLQHLHIDLSDCSQLSDVSSIGEGMKKVSNLRRLYMNFSMCSQIEDVGSFTENMQRLSNLQHLCMNFSGCSKLRKLLQVGMNMPDLKHLCMRFAGCTMITSVKCIGVTLKECRNLQHLHMDFSESKLEDVSDIGKHMKEWKQLYRLHICFAWCVNIKDVSSIVTGVKTLRSLQEFCVRLNGTDVKQPAKDALEAAFLCCNS